MMVIVTNDSDLGCGDGAVLVMMVVDGIVMVVKVTVKSLSAIVMVMVMEVVVEVYEHLLCAGYDTFCPVSGFIPKEKIPNPHNIDLWLKVLARKQISQYQHSSSPSFLQD